ncbi:pantoate--beta-alanine ligase [Marispirochaeta sp.]|uniref:pantoate--beta-alanine ligase n=1 Tax=Marispirochaeta sp. TaxID=2038653 RepID=UPI0029C7E9E7|nr:pantoate--beta-alanine ligase [Marispirochaeta sp.]
MKVLQKATKTQDFCRAVRAAGEQLGFVPTMGALHRGHLSLVERAKQENLRVAVSIFVNPTQFDDREDLQNYPQNYDSDQEALRNAGVDLLFLPAYDEIYADTYRYRISENKMSREMEGAHRPGHFDGVLTVVMKLLNIIHPHRAYFGEKDWQQYLLVRDMARTFFLDTEIIPCPLVREDDGLAMSSRNARLTAEYRRTAPKLYEILSRKGSAEEKRQELLRAGFEVDYVVKRNGRILAAAVLGNVRLLDNVPAN